MHKDAYKVRTSLYKSMSMYTEPHNDLVPIYEFMPSNLPVKSVSNSSKISFQIQNGERIAAIALKASHFGPPKKNTATNALLTLWNDYLFNQNPPKNRPKIPPNKKNMTTTLEPSSLIFLSGRQGSSKIE